MNLAAMVVAYRGLVVAACEWRAVGVADPEDMAEEVFGQLDVHADHDLHDLYASIERVVLASYQRYAEQFSVLERLREGAAIIRPRRTRTPADDFLSALSRLRNADRELIQLRFWDELSDAEAAEVLRTTTETVRSRLARAGTRYLARLARTHPDLALTDVADTVRSIKPGVHRRFETGDQP
ncbi:sigma factor-like helix-turn-helix DNA-binding protein [Propionicimonas sp.]|uniref:sigma factor-like helix-turn-helix DNA-binding protein n=1 Tax=Propionicimonas sp. TaxID=1955623 RepID=UPI0039E4390F